MAYELLIWRYDIKEVSNIFIFRNFYQLFARELLYNILKLGGDQYKISRMYTASH